MNINLECYIIIYVLLYNSNSRIYKNKQMLGVSLDIPTPKHSDLFLSR